MRVIHNDGVIEVGTSIVLKVGSSEKAGITLRPVPTSNECAVS